MKTYKFKLTTLSPLHIGNGEKWYSFEYWHKNNTLFIADFWKFVDNFVLKGDDWGKRFNQLLDLFRISMGANRMELNFTDVLTDFNLKGEENKFKSNLLPSPLNNNVYDKGGELKKVIEQYIKHPNGSYFIPGSSVKGAIKTAILYGLLKNEDLTSLWNDYNDYREVLDRVFDYSSQNNLHIPDIELPNINGYIDVTNRIGMGTQRGKLSAIEVINIKESNEVYLIVKTEFSFSELRDLINNFYCQAITDILKIKSVDANSDLKEAFSNIRNVPQNEGNTIIIQLGKGGDYFTKSLGILLKEFAQTRNIDDKDLTKLRSRHGFGFPPKINHPLKPFPKTFPITSSNKPFGWVKLTFEENA